MPITVSEARFRIYLRSARFATHGDSYERQFPTALTEAFPACRTFWAVLVVPATKRVDQYPDAIGGDIGFRDSVPDAIQDIASAHYSMTTHLASAHIQVAANGPHSLEYTYIHLPASCDLAETVVEKWFFLQLQNQGRVSITLRGLSLDEFLAMARRWYEHSYPEFHEHYLKRGKGPPIKLPSRQDILAEYLGNAPPRTRFLTIANEIRSFRNTFVHDVRLARILTADGVFLVPKPSRLHSYRTWREVFAVPADAQVLRADFVERFEQARNHISSLEASLEDIWQRIVDEIEVEFYSIERPALRQSLDIELNSGPQPSGLPSTSASFASLPYVPPSGTYGGASIDKYEQT